MQTGCTLAIRIHSWHDPVSSIETRIREKHGVMTSQQWLLFAGKAMAQDEWPLANYGIRACSTLEVLGRLRGGMPAQSDAMKGHMAMTPAETTTNPTAANSFLLAWAKWVQGPYQALLKNAHFEQQLDVWELGFLQALTQQEVPKGAIAAMTLRAGMALVVGGATRAMAAYIARMCPGNA